MTDTSRPDLSGGLFRVPPVSLWICALMAALALIAYDRGVPVYRAQTTLAVPAGAAAAAEQIAYLVNDDRFIWTLADEARRAGSSVRGVDDDRLAGLKRRIAATPLASGDGITLSGEGATPAQARATVALGAAAAHRLIASQIGATTAAPTAMEPYIERLAFGPPGELGAMLFVALGLMWFARPGLPKLLVWLRHPTLPHRSEAAPDAQPAEEEQLELPPDRVGPALADAIGAARLVLVAGPPPRAASTGSAALPPARKLASALARAGEETLLVDLVPPPGEVAADPVLAAVIAGEASPAALIRTTAPGGEHALTLDGRACLCGDGPARLEALLKGFGPHYERVIVHIGDLAGIPALDHLMRVADHVVLIEPDTVASPRTQAVSERFCGDHGARRLTVAMAPPAQRRHASPFGVRAGWPSAAGSRFGRRVDTRRTG
ncbi:ParA family protein [Segnochrobactraceae bacterium EtOH-i3]